MRLDTEEETETNNTERRKHDSLTKKETAKKNTRKEGRKEGLGDKTPQEERDINN